MFYTEAKLSTKDRDKLKDSDFGVPALRKFPLTDANHVRSAIRYFDKCPEKYKPILAKRIKAAAKKYGVDLNDKRILAYTEAAVYQEAPGDNTNNQNNRRNQNNQQQNEPATPPAEEDDPDPEDYSADTGADVDTPDATEDGTPDYTTEQEPDDEPAEELATTNAPDDTGATADTQPAGTTAAPTTTDTTPADTTDPGAATIDTGANTTNTDVNSGANTPDTAGDAGTDTTTGGGDVGTDTDEPTDYTGDNIDGASGDDPAAAGDDATGDDMGGEDGTEGEGDDTTTDDGTVDDGTADAAAGGDMSGVDSELQQLQQDVFSNLTDAQLALRVNNVKDSFIELYNSITNTAQRLVDVKRSSENISTINFLNDQLNSLKGMVRDALTDSFSTKSLAENEMVLQKFISIYALILKIVERISKKEKNENKDEKEDSSFTDED